MSILRIKRNRDDCWSFSNDHGVEVQTPIHCGVGVDPVEILNKIHDWAGMLADSAGHQTWTGLIDELVENKGKVSIESICLAVWTYSFEEIEKFFSDKPALYADLYEEPTATTINITVTPWEPIQGDPILLRLPNTMADSAISQLVRMFLVEPVREVRWQRGHVELKSYAVEDSSVAHEGFAAVCYNGVGRYVRI